ncbi:hypothetical protein MPSEU_000220200 [Mayamaea pseudoterrestris]|nr:hypothetical protein MPSEU_000220200 [Mayamaea pseudoterrestris]
MSDSDKDDEAQLGLAEKENNHESSYALPNKERIIEINAAKTPDGVSATRKHDDMTELGCAICLQKVSKKVIVIRCARGHNVCRDCDERLDILVRGKCRLKTCQASFESAKEAANDTKDDNDDGVVGDAAPSAKDPPVLSEESSNSPASDSELSNDNGELRAMEHVDHDAKHAEKLASVSENIAFASSSSSSSTVNDQPILYADESAFAVFQMPTAGDDTCGYKFHLLANNSQNVAAVLQSLGALRDRCENLDPIKSNLYTSDFRTRLYNHWMQFLVLAKEHVPVNERPMFREALLASEHSMLSTIGKGVPEFLHQANRDIIESKLTETRIHFLCYFYVLEQFNFTIADLGEINKILAELRAELDSLVKDIIESRRYLVTKSELDLEEKEHKRRLSLQTRTASKRQRTKHHHANVDESASGACVLYIADSGEVYHDLTRRTSCNEFFIKANRNLLCGIEENAETMDVIPVSGEQVRDNSIELGGRDPETVEVGEGFKIRESEMPGPPCDASHRPIQSDEAELSRVATAEEKDLHSDLMVVDPNESTQFCADMKVLTNEEGEYILAILTEGERIKASADEMACTLDTVPAEIRDIAIDSEAEIKEAVFDAATTEPTIFNSHLELLRSHEGPDQQATVPNKHAASCIQFETEQRNEAKLEELLDAATTDPNLVQPHSDLLGSHEVPDEQATIGTVHAATYTEFGIDQVSEAKLDGELDAAMIDSTSIGAREMVRRNHPVPTTSARVSIKHINTSAQSERDQVADFHQDTQQAPAPAARSTDTLTSPPSRSVRSSRRHCLKQKQNVASSAKSDCARSCRRTTRSMSAAWGETPNTFVTDTDHRVLDKIMIGPHFQIDLVDSNFKREPSDHDCSCIWNPVMADEAEARGEPIEEFLHPLGSLERRTLKMEALHLSNYSVPAAQERLHLMIASSKCANISMTGTEAETFNLLILNEDGQNSNKNFQSIAAMMDRPMQVMLVQYYRWKSNNPNIYKVLKGKCQSECTICHCSTKAHLFLCESCAKAYHWSCLYGPCKQPAKSERFVCYDCNKGGKLRIGSSLR